MKKNLYLIALLLLVCLIPATAQNKITGINNVKLFLDPGHALKENQGLYKYSEAEKVLRVAKAVKEYLLTHTDMQEANIRLCREDDNTQVTLTERTDAANAWGADFYYSIHSDAGSPSSNSTLFMYGGWRTNGEVLEKTPYGGKDYGEILAPNLTGVMRISTRGSMADRTYYDAAQNHANKYPYLHVNRESNMASLLSEAGFHTSPFQQARNLNADYKRLEAYAAFQSLALFLSNKFGTNPGGALPIPGIAFGTVSDNETNELVNDVTVTIDDGSGEKIYVTDSYDSLFKNYSNKSNEIHNGFFFFEGLTPGATATIKVEAEGYESKQSTITIPDATGAATVDGMAVKDFALTNITAPVVTNLEYTGSSLNAVAIDKPMTLTFSRKMDRSSVELALSISPAGSLSYVWINDFTLNIDLSLLSFETDYILKIDGSIAKNSLTGQYLNGNDDDSGSASDYIVNFTTGEQDLTPPNVVAFDPQDNLPLTVEVSRPIVRIQFSEYLNEARLAPDQITVTDPNGETVGGIQKYTAINHIGVLHYFFTTDLQPNKTYTVHLAPGVEDLYGNAITTPLDYSFTVKPRTITFVTSIDDFEGAMAWPVDPKQNSGTTSGVVQENTTLALESSITASTDSEHGMILNYQWSDEAAAKTIRFTKTATTPKFNKVAENTMRIYVFGDASNSTLRLTVREGGSGTIWSCKPILIDWAGWRLVSWNPETDEGEAWLAGTTIPTGTSVNFACFGMHGAPADQLSLTPSYIVFDDIQIVEVGDYITSIPEVQTDGIHVVTVDKMIQITASQAINAIRVYSLGGVLLKSVQPGQAAYQIPTGDLPQGAYIVKVIAGTSQKNVTALVK